MGNIFKNRYVRFYLIYTVLFLSLIFVIFHPFLANSISFVWNVDGWTQHYKAIYLYSNWLKDIVRSVIHNHKLNISLYSFSLGYGSDLITTLHYYVVGDPLCLLSVLVPEDKIPFFYTISIYLRLYLAGITFSMYCFFMKHRNLTAIMAGTFLYCLPLSVANMQLHHPFFTNPFIYLLLLLIGVEMIIRKSSKLPFILAVFLSAVSNFYFFYMLVILTVIYVLIRLAALWKDNRAAGTFRLLSVYLGSGITGVLLSFPILLPVLHLIMSGSRLETSKNVGLKLFYTPHYYKGLFTSLFTVNSSLGLSCVGFCCLVLLFLKRGNRELKAGVIVLSAIFLLPIGGRMMNGFSYETDRWIFGLIFLLAYIVTTMWEDLFGCSVMEAAIMLGAFFLCFALMFWIISDLKLEMLLHMLKYVLLLGVAAGICFMIPKLTARKSLYRLSSLACLLIVCMSIVLRLHVCFAPSWQNQLETYVSYKLIQEDMLSKVDRAVLAAGASKDGFYRYGSPHGETDRNSAAISGLKGISYYWSLADDEVSNLYFEMGIPMKNEFNYRTLDGITSLTDLGSVKYYVIKSMRGRKRMIPYGFERMDLKKGKKRGADGYSVYTNKYLLPMGYTYDSVITDDQYESMNFVEKQNALLQGIHISEEKMPTYPKTDVVQDYKTLPFRLVSADGVKMEHNHYLVTRENGKLVFEIDDAEPGCTTSLMIHGISFTPPPSKVDDYYQELALIKTHFQEQGEEEITSKLYLGTDNYFKYLDRHDFLVNMGYSEEPKKTFSIEFPEKGDYQIDRLTVCSQPMTRYPAMLNKLRENVLEDIAFEGNTFTGRIDLKKDKILCLSIPYSEGWKAWVNGTPVKTIKANTMYTAIPLKKGVSKIRLHYCTPLLPQGLICFCAGFMICVIIFVFEKRGRGKTPSGRRRRSRRRRDRAASTYLD